MTFPFIDGVTRGRIDGGGGDHRIELGTTQTSIDHNVPQDWFTEYNLDISQASVAFHPLADKLTFNVENITFDAAGDSGRWKAQCLIGGVVEWERNINPGETSVTLAVEIDVTGYQSTTQDITFRLKSTTDANPAAALQSVQIFRSTENLTIDGDLFSPNASSEEHIVVVGYDKVYAPIWKVHVRAQPGQLLKHVYGTGTDGGVLIHPDGYVIVTARNFFQSPGAVGDSLVDIFPDGGGPATVVTNRARQATTYNSMEFIFRINLDGSIGWASPCLTVDVDTPYAGNSDIRIDDIRHVDDTKFACTMHLLTSGSGVGVSQVATFLPGSDGTKNQTHWHGESWFMEVNYADGTVVAQPERYALEVYRLGGGNNISNYNIYGGLGAARSDSGKTANFWNVTSNVWNGIGDGVIYRGGSNPGYPSVEDSPSPGYPTNFRWEKRQLTANREASLLVREANGDVRYAMQFGTSEPFALGAASVPATDDFLVACYAQNGGGELVRFRRDSPENGVYEPAIGSVLSTGKYGGYVVRVNDNPVTPLQPTIAWACHYNVSGAATSGSLLLRMGQVMPESNLFITVGRVDGVSTVSWKPNTGPLASLGMGYVYGAPASGFNYNIMGTRYTDGTPIWVAGIESSQTVALAGYARRRGREFLIDCYWVDDISFHHWEYADLQISGFVPPNAVEFSLSSAGVHHGIARFDISTGVFKGYTNLLDDPLGASSAYFFNNRRDVADIKDDLAVEMAVVGSAFSSAAPVVTNSSGALNFTTEQALAGWQSIAPGTGVISGTPAAPDIGEHVDVIRVEDANGDFSFANKRSIYVEPIPDRRWRFDDVAGPTAVEEYAGANGTYGGSALVNQAGKIGGAFHAVNNTSGGVSLPTLNLGPNFTFSMWMNPATWSASDANGYLFDFRTGLGSNNYGVRAQHVGGAQPGAVRLSVYSAVGVLLGTVTTPNFYFTSSGWVKWSFWVDGLTMGMSRGVVQWTGALSAPMPAGNRTHCAIGQYHTGSSGFAIESDIDHAELWLNHAVNPNSLAVAFGIENGGTPAF